MKKQGKGLLLTSGILEIIYSCLIILGSIFIIGVSFSAASIIKDLDSSLGSFTTSIMVAVGLLALAIGILFLVFGIISVKICNKEVNKYLESKGKVLAFAIVETVFLVLSILGSIPQKGADPSTTTTIVSSILVCVLFALVAAFKYAAYALMVKQSKNAITQTT